jgi:hypothetical protein
MITDNMLFKAPVIYFKMKKMAKYLFQCEKISYKMVSSEDLRFRDFFI